MMGLLNIYSIQYKELLWVPGLIIALSCPSLSQSVRALCQSCYMSLSKLIYKDFSNLLHGFVASCKLQRRVVKNGYFTVRLRLRFYHNYQHHHHHYRHHYVRGRYSWKGDAALPASHCGKYLKAEVCSPKWPTTTISREVRANNLQTYKARNVQQLNLSEKKTKRQKRRKIRGQKDDE